MKYYFFFGGSWGHYNVDSRLSYRYFVEPFFLCSGLGFRLIKTVKL
jgi:hypothetical protein